ncbi:hypothetical protein S40293_10954 [Stachybotrys chartarum IBT 40293]|nr:hypothetical protein S40293_10954 [Stachybotrys chartarum IBT 40293]
MPVLADHNPSTASSVPQVITANYPKYAHNFTPLHTQNTSAMMMAQIARATPVAMIRKKTNEPVVPNSPEPVNLPEIQLETTLANLYRQASSRHGRKRIAQVLSCVNAGIALTPDVPRNTKYLYQDGCFNSTIEKDETANTKANRQRQLAIKYLSLIAQRDAFVSGDTHAIFFYIGDFPEQIAHDKSQAEETLAVLPASQRPKLLFCSGPDSIPLENEGIDFLAHKIMLDGLEKYPLLNAPETHWTINSKLALAKSGLPTPRCEYIELDGYIAEAAECCAACQKDPEAFPIVATCNGNRGKWIEKQSALIHKKLAERELPFVLKNQQTFGGAGTYIIRTEDERRRITEELQSGILRKLLSAVTKDNVHLEPGTLILSDMVKDPIGDYGLTFFVNDDGRDPTFLAASEQITNGEGAWMGSTINYSRQLELKKKFEPLVKKIARWIQGHGYIGPAGADILETAASSDDKDNFHIVDLNIRTSGSLCLPLLRGHFTSRGLPCASSSSVSTRMNRKNFIALFSKEFSSGQMCILSWYEDTESGMSVADVAIGAVDEQGLEEAMKRMAQVTEQITF